MKVPLLTMFNHRCNPNLIGAAFRKNGFTCKICLRRWKYEGKNTWHSEGGDVSKIHAVVMRDADGTFRVIA